ncbi:hypothetical protein C172_14383 [Paenibacillus sp. FSL H8-457]|nr:hypothetical protein C172_14383 [Paenibacillus sp. FSL H8-457]
MPGYVWSNKVKGYSQLILCKIKGEGAKEANKLGVWPVSAIFILASHRLLVYDGGVKIIFLFFSYF